MISADDITNHIMQVNFSRPLSGDSVCVELHRGYRTSYRRGTRFIAQLGVSPQYSHQFELKVYICPYIIR